MRSDPARWGSSLSPTARTGSVQAMNDDGFAGQGGTVRRPHDPRAPRRPERLPDIDTGRCTGCGRCVAVCDPHLLSLEVVRWKKFAVLHEPGRCTGCNACAASCPFHAITLRKQVAAG
jgi:ferredoxin